MYQSTEKGDTVTLTDHSSKARPIRTGSPVLLGAFLGGSSRRISSYRSGVPRLAVSGAPKRLLGMVTGALALMAATLLCASAAFAATPGKPEIPLSHSESTPHVLFLGGAASGTTARFRFYLKSNGSETAYHVEYSLPEAGHAPAANGASWQQFTTGGSGTVTATEEYVGPYTEHYSRGAEDHTLAYAETAGLTPETTYYVRVRARNAVGELVQTLYTSEAGAQEVSTFTTLTLRPEVSVPEVRNVTATSAYASGINVNPHGSQTTWRLELAESETGPWASLPGKSGTISQAQAEALSYHETVGLPGGRITGLKSSTVYYLRVVAENTCEHYCGTTTGSVSVLKPVVWRARARSGSMRCTVNRCGCWARSTPTAPRPTLNRSSRSKGRRRAGLSPSARRA